ncbi:lactase-phlorizin hydrolase-like [Denticeps clupeoides]|uniref:lactase-phlorizin hydrolase-like n=1 Tax=Denticeps clupeoides TaxID=299321 RepID=UPI0010A4C96A|nr:lactase-phlorizin hydrolase [Denticeps clupeoides]
MRPLLGIVSLCLLATLCCHGNAASEQDFMLLAGPLSNSNLKGLSAETEDADYLPHCSSGMLRRSRESFQDLHSHGVTHFKVPLSWTHIFPNGDAGDHREEAVNCYRTLLTELTESGLKPLVVLHRSRVPEDLRATHGGWENPKVSVAFQHYAAFAFHKFGDLVNSWVTFSHVDELRERDGKRMDEGNSGSSFQNALNVHAKVYQLYHHTYPSRVAVGLRLSDVSAASQYNTMGYTDFLSLRAEFDCISKTNLQDQLNAAKDTTETTTVPSTYEKVWKSFSSQSPSVRDDFLNASFPNNFQWAVSSESFKVEGGWSEGGKGETIWDRFSHEGHVFENQTADMACDSYNKLDYDVYLLRGLMTRTFQFSLSWARIFPTGLRGSLSETGVLYYDQLINTLLQSGIEPSVTLHHWDLPQALQEKGGWNNASIVEAFKDFADFCFSRYGDRVKTWSTFSSPWVISHFGYGTGDHPPRITDPVVASYEVTFNILRSHAEAWHVYNDKYRKQQGGKVGVSLNSDWTEPQNPSQPQDIEAAERYLHFTLGWFAHPIFVNGDYPVKLTGQILEKNKHCSSEVARLPAFTESERKRIQGTADFFGLNHYTSYLVSQVNGGCLPGLNNVGDFQTHVDPAWPPTVSSSIYSVPWGLRRLLNYISDEYTSVSGVPIYITGNGVPTGYNTNLLNDTQRVDFLKKYINEALKAINLDGVSVERFTVQSLMDGFEGPQGYSERFGLHYVNFDDMDRPRTPKESAYVYSQIIENNGFEPNSSPKQMARSEASRRAFLPPSDVPSKSKVVWEKFSNQNKFQRKRYHHGTFPDNFLWGVSSSAYQVEGGWNADGKGPSTWDTFSQKPGNILNNDNGDVACDSYNKFNEDLYMLRALRVKSYRFSLSWSRIFPNGNKTSVNNLGVDYYNRIINGLLAHNITPMVTLHHWDLPQALQDIGGWQNLNMIDIFNEFCDFCFDTFGDRVKFWMTFNQPHTIAWVGYGLGLMPPSIKKPGEAPYMIAHNLLKAHAKVYHTYDEKYKKLQGGLVSITLNADWIEPKDADVPREIAAADRALQFQLGWFAHPIFKNGDYPDAMKWQVGNKSELQGHENSRIPTFTAEEKAYIQGTADFFSINTYTSRVAHHTTMKILPASYETDQDLQLKNPEDSQSTAVKELRAAAWGLRRLLNWIKEEYGDPDIYISENGIATDTKTTVDDTDRFFFYKTYIDEALKAHNLDGVKLKGYTAWSLMDSFEWLSGYTVGFGLHHVDFKNPIRPRTPKRSALYYYQVIRDNGFPLPEEEKLIYGHFRNGFAWSVSTSSYQIEGGWRSDGKGLSIWDKFAHTPLRVWNDDTGDIACDSYNKIAEDVDMLKRLKVTHYRFSISWPRVLPDGTNRFINEAGLNYYHRLVDALLAVNIQPQVTLYHWDLPQALQDHGGWENETVVERFKEYADVIFKNLGHKVKFWITINEPYNVANIGHGYGTAAPGISFRPGTLPYIVAHNLLKAHAEAWHLYNDKYRAEQGGIISITINSDWAEPRNPYKQEDIDAARRVIQFYIGWFAHPVFNGDYNDVMKTVIRERSLAAGLAKSRLPEFTPAEVERIKGTYDYFGFNHYTTVLAFKVDYKNLQHYDADRGAGTIADRAWLDSGSSWLKVTPVGFRKILNFIKDEYGNPPIYITENGISERGPMDLNDEHRTHYYDNYINQALKAYLLDGVDIRGYTAWTLMDNLEWATGFEEKFGLFYVNRSDPSLPRIAKQSVKHYSTIISCNGFPEGPHECLSPDLEGTTPPTTTPDKAMGVNFLGMAVSIPDAEVALSVLFSFTIIGAVCAALTTCLYIRAKKRSKQDPQDNIVLERRL